MLPHSRPLLKTFLIRTIRVFRSFPLPGVLTIGLLKGVVPKYMSKIHRRNVFRQLLNAAHAHPTLDL